MASYSGLSRICEWNIIERLPRACMPGNTARNRLHACVYVALPRGPAHPESSPRLSWTPPSQLQYPLLALAEHVLSLYIKKTIRTQFSMVEHSMILLLRGLTSQLYRFRNPARTVYVVWRHLYENGIVDDLSMC